MKWKGKTALITAGATGIGFGIARAFAEAGIDLILTYRDEGQREYAQTWFKEHRSYSPRFVALDVTNREQWSQLAGTLGPVDILVNNAGVSIFGPTDEASYADYDWIMSVNFGGVVNSLVSFLPLMKAAGRGGHIINVASMAAFLTGPQAGIYTASKFAVRGLTESLRYNLIPYGIGVSLMCPGLTRTGAWASALKRPDAYGSSGFPSPDGLELAQFGKAFDYGMDPLEVGEKTLAGMIENKALILTHPEFSEDFECAHRDLMAALPDGPAPAERVHIESLRRAANAAALSGHFIALKDLT